MKQDLQRPTNLQFILPNRFESFTNTYQNTETAKSKTERIIQEYVRAQYQAMECLKMGGYMIFDTLTYNEENLPHIWDIIQDMNINVKTKTLKKELNISCFRPLDIRLFLARLRRHLNYWYNINENCFNYLICSEYGTDETKTMRPHYHIIFYVMTNKIDPINFSKAIKECWGKGLTDGVDDKGIKYFKEKRLFTTETKNSLNTSILNVVDYITKYIGKQENFENKFDKIKNNLIKELWGHDDIEDEFELWKIKSKSINEYRTIKKFLRNCRPFSKKGHGYGEYYIKWLQNGSDEATQQLKNICETATLIIPMNKNQKIYKAPLPQYYYRKLFMEEYYDWQGKKQWRLSTFGMMWWKKQKENAIKNTVNKMEEWYMNRGQLQPLEEYDLGWIYGNKKCFQNDMETIERCTKGKQRKKMFEFIATWNNLYEGRIKSSNREPDKNSGNIWKRLGLPEKNEMLEIQLINKQYHNDINFQNAIMNGHKIGNKVTFEGNEILFNYATDYQKKFYGKQLICNCFMGNDGKGYERIENIQHENIKKTLWGEKENDWIKTWDPTLFETTMTWRLIDLKNNPLLLIEQQRYVRDCYELYDVYKRYARDHKQKYEEKYDFLHDLEKRLGKAYKITEKHKK